MKYLHKIKSFFNKKRTIWTIVGVIVVLFVYFVFIRESTNSSIQIAIVKKQDIEKTVLTTGQVVSATDLSLSFQTSGYVRRINVKEGDVVYQGQTLAVLDQGNTVAQLESARGALAQAEANYKKISSAATEQDIAVSQAGVDTARVTLENAKQNLLNQISTAYNNANIAVLSYTNILFSNPQSNAPQFGVTGTNQTNSQLVTAIDSERTNINLLLPAWQSEILTINQSNLDLTIDHSVQYLNTISAYLSDIITILSSYTQVTSGGSQTTVSTYQSNVATAKSTVDSSITTILTYKQTVKSAGASLAQSEASLGLKKAPARPEDIGIAEAQVISAQGQVHLAESNLSNTLITAPAPGTITLVNIKLGELATAGREVIKLLDVGRLHTEVQVSEADIAVVKVGQEIDNTFDALGPDKHYKSKVLTVNPASTVVSGVVNYKVTGSLENIPEVKPGMTSNMTILITEKKDVLVAPSSAIINKDSKKLIRVVDDVKLKTYHEVEIQTGLEADGGLVEIVSGLNSGQEIVTYIK